MSGSTAPESRSCSAPSKTAPRSTSCCRTRWARPLQQRSAPSQRPLSPRPTTTRTNRVLNRQIRAGVKPQEAFRRANCAAGANPLKPNPTGGRSVMAEQNPLLERLAAGGAVSCHWVALGSVAAAEVMAEARPDAIMFDTQHGLWDKQNLYSAFAAIRG